MKFGKIYLIMKDYTKLSKKYKITPQAINVSRLGEVAEHKTSSVVQTLKIR